MAISTEFPELQFIPARAYGNGRDGKTVKLSVVHFTAGSERNTSAEDGAAYDQHRTDGTSCHLFHDQNSSVQCVYRWNRANSAFHKGNRLGVHHELCGTAQTRAQWLDPASDATLWRAAHYVADDCRTYGLQPRRLTVPETRATWYSNGPGGIVGHVDITYAFPEDGGSHEDPGPGFPWDIFLARVNQILNGEENDMDADQDARLKRIDDRVTTLLYNTPTNQWGSQAGERNQLREQLDRVEAAAGPDSISVNLPVEQIKSALLDVLLSPAGKAAIVAAVNEAEDS